VVDIRQNFLCDMKRLYTVTMRNKKYSLPLNSQAVN